MSVVARGGDAGARSHAESLSGVGGHTSRSFSTFREKIRDIYPKKQSMHLLNCETETRPL